MTDKGRATPFELAGEAMLSLLREGRFYLLDGRSVVPVRDDGSGVPLVVQWATQLTDAMTQVARDDVDGERTVSTVFLGVDHSRLFGDEDTPATLFETMTTRTDGTVEDVVRCRTLDEAEQLHVETLRELRARGTR